MVLFLLLLITLLTSSVKAQEDDCGITDFVDTFGYISSPNYPQVYPDNHTCTYTIFATAGSSHTLTFLAFAVERNYDYIDISCATNASFPTIRYSGFYVPPTTSIPWCSSAEIFFYADLSFVTYEGFNIQYQVNTGGCGNTAYSRPYGYINSPGYPSNYDNNQNCSNIIWAAEPTSIDISFEEFALQDCDNCSCDWLEIRCLDDNTDYGRYCGAAIPEDIHIDQCQQVLLWFQSDDGIFDTGFSVSYDIAVPTVGSCGSNTFYDTSGLIISPNFPGDYDNNLRCYYTIYASTGASYTFRFLSFDVEDYWDYVDVICFSNATFRSIRYTGYSNPPPTSVPWCADAQIYFYTDATNVYTGFSIGYQVSTGGCGNTVFTGSSGNFSSPGYPSNYDNNQNCSYIIWAPVISFFNLVFSEFSLESCDDCTCDWLEVICLDDGTNYGRYCGSNPPPGNVITINSPCTQVLVWFSSNDNTVFEGFHIDYTVNPAIETDGCGNKDFIGTYGYISSPNYPQDYDNNLKCAYTIYAPIGSSHTLTFLSFMVDDGYDFVVISCATNSSFNSITYTGFNIPPTTSIPWCGSSQIYFETDATGTYSGFQIYFQVSTGGCGNTVFAAASGTLTTPGYPSNYDNNQNCSYFMAAGAKTTMDISFDVFSLQNCVDCSCDWVEIRCFDDMTNYGRYCGPFIPDPIHVENCQRVLVWFQSDGATVDAGFSASYNIILRGPSSGDCGIVDFTDPTGVITSPNYPENYNSNLRCYYTIYSEVGSTHTLTFQAFQTESVFDYIEVYCSTNSSFARIRYSGNSLPDVTTIPWCANALIYFFTDNTVEYSGFSISYEVTVFGSEVEEIVDGSAKNIYIPDLPFDYIEPNQLHRRDV